MQENTFKVESDTKSENISKLSKKIQYLAAYDHFLLPDSYYHFYFHFSRAHQPTKKWK